MKTSMGIPSLSTFNVSHAFEYSYWAYEQGIPSSIYLKKVIDTIIAMDHKTLLSSADQMI